MPGPIPNRSDQRVRRNLPDIPIDTITTIGPVDIPDLGIPDAHQLVVDLYDSMKVSAQKRFFEPSDWATARLTMYLINDMLKGKGEDHRISPMMVSSVSSLMTSLLLTEGDRRKMRIEVERSQSSGDAQVISVADHFKKQLEAQGK